MWIPPPPPLNVTFIHVKFGRPNFHIAFGIGAGKLFRGDVITFLDVNVLFRAPFDCSAARLHVVLNARTVY